MKMEPQKAPSSPNYPGHDLIRSGKIALLLTSTCLLSSCEEEISTVKMKADEIRFYLEEKYGDPSYNTITVHGLIAEDIPSSFSESTRTLANQEILPPPWNKERPSAGDLIIKIPENTRDISIPIPGLDDESSPPTIVTQM